ncbi:hypothetical protein BBO99_00008339 [Phytophthora kernoviae]|uniref:Uncharacterized protein n=2 Tax=Phytophthora kernoviae TaxID=325452 RepID=A0A3R7KFV4_9STRA|nr:hypothetical protein G195_009996 [Phytophthora kernoviae 00238/432]KAG2509947.1 hypothetical protein JM16_008395 [Phytophthora kernoviae]KAG2512332.1 hypothetical protein JM18_008206 [Phytophthora kernoviae]RLN21266.1 hypothetical protein BBI17_008277 [Phytophthora kernoviae]RLN75427.1 hypothetical protein BBO99_00008339 [Phytophthora kernoviae]
MEIWAPWETSVHARELIGPNIEDIPVGNDQHPAQEPPTDDPEPDYGGTWLGPLACVRVVRRSRPDMSALPHVWEAVEAFLDCSPNCSLTQAAAFGSMRLLRGISARSGAMTTLDPFYKQAQFSGAMQHAAARGDLEMVRWLLNFQPGGLVTKAVEQAARNGQLEVLRWLKQHHDQVFWGANELRHSLCKYQGVPVEDAAAAGHLKIVKWLHKSGVGIATPRAIDNAAAHGHLEVVKWLHRKKDRIEGCTVQAMDGAAAGGHLRIVKWLHTNRSEGCTEAAMDGAAAHGKLDMLKWLHKNRSEGCTTAAMDRAAAGGHFEVLLFLHNKRSEGCTMDAAVNASRNEHMEILQWFFRFYPRMIHREKVIVFAKRYNYYLMDWLHRNYQASGERTLLAEINSSFYLTPPETEVLDT